MPATYTNGFGGSITFASTVLAVGTWSLNIQGEALETTNTADAGWKSHILGMKSFDGNLETFWDTSAVPTGVAGFTPGARGTVILPVGATGKSYTGTVQLTKIGIKNEAKGVVTFSCDFEGTGVLTSAT